MRLISVTSLSKFADSYAVSAFAYVLVAGACACIEWGTFYLLLGRTDVRIAAFYAFLIATLANYALSRLIAFHSVRRVSHEALLLLGVSTVAFVFNFATFMFVYRVGYPAMAAKILGTGIAFGINYGLRQFLVFSRVPRFGRLSSYVGASSPAPQYDDL
jgi:putative flippase GtrA